MSNKKNETVETMNGATVDLSQITERMASILAIDTSDMYEKINAGTDKESEIIKKVYDFATPIGKRTQLTTYDMSIIESTEKIAHAINGKKMLTYVICREFSNIAESGKLENMGFKNIAEYGKALFGFEVSTVNHYARIGKNFITEDYNIIQGLPCLSVSHLIELNGIAENGNTNDIISLYQNGTLVDGMSTKKIREVLKDINNPKIEVKTEVAENKSESTSSSESKSNDFENTELLKVNFSSQVVIGKILNACNAIDDMFAILEEHNIRAVGYSDSIETIKGIAKELIE